MVYLLDSTTTVGQSSNIKSPWKGSYLVTKVLSHYIISIPGQKRESTIHHDRIKQMNWKNYPLWIKQARNKLLKLQTDKPPINDITHLPQISRNLNVTRPAAGPVCPAESQGQPSLDSPKPQGSRPTRTHKILKHLSDFDLDSN